MSITFENTSTRTSVVKYYSITGVPPLTTMLGRTKTDVLPFSVKFEFVDGEFFDVTVFGKIVRKRGGVSERVVKVPNIHTWSQSTWPYWLKDLRTSVFSDFQEHFKTAISV